MSYSQVTTQDDLNSLNGSGATLDQSNGQSETGTPNGPATPPAASPEAGPVQANAAGDQSISTGPGSSADLTTPGTPQAGSGGPAGPGGPGAAGDQAGAGGPGEPVSPPSTPGTPGTPGAQPGQAFDPSFAQSALASGVTEILSGQVAYLQSTDPNVRAFAERMIIDHTAQNQELLKLLEQANIQPTFTLQPQQLEALESLVNLRGNQLNTAYLQGQVATHDQTIQVFKTEATQGQDTELKSFAARYLPGLQNHEQTAASLLQQEAAGPGAPGSPPATPGAQPLQTFDPGFVQLALASGLTEILSGQVASLRSTDPNVRAFAERMITEHTAQNQEFLKVLDQADIGPTFTLQPQQLEALGTLSTLSGNQFDSAYLQGQIAAHDQTIQIYQTEVNQGQIQTLQSFATRYLPDLQNHEQSATALLQQEMAAGSPQPPGGGQTGPGAGTPGGEPAVTAGQTVAGVQTTTATAAGTNVQQVSAQTGPSTAGGQPLGSVGAAPGPDGQHHDDQTGHANGAADGSGDGAAAAAHALLAHAERAESAEGSTGGAPVETVSWIEWDHGHDGTAAVSVEASQDVAQDDGQHIHHLVTVAHHGDDYGLS